MLADEVATYLAAAGLGLTVGVDLFTLPWPATAPDLAVSLVESDAGPSEQHFGPSLSAPQVERPGLTVMVRGGRDAAETARAKAHDTYKRLRRLGPVTLSGVLYHHVDAEPPQFLDFDDNGRPVFVFRCDVWKEESP